MRVERRADGAAVLAGERRLTACPACHRQYDVSRRATGAQFHCRCGELLTVAEVRAHDAAVVRCSSCGAPREAATADCSFCGADFTLHERDLRTICPGCMARVSDHARYCHQCATLIAPQGTAGDLTERLCPACGEASPLVSRSLGGRKVSVLECGRCAGLWLGNAVFVHLEKGALRTEPPGDSGRPEGARPAAIDAATPEETVRYRPCPICASLMHRRNYGRKSGVVVDTCQQHGLWFDQGELGAILDWIHAGGMARARQWQQQMDAEEERARRLGRDERTATAWLDKDVGPAASPLSSFIDGLLQYLERG